MEKIEKMNEEISSEELDTLDTYKVELDNFNGPMDLLLHLIRESKIDIKDIFISKITEQFIEYVSKSTISAEKIGDFMLMASTLLEIKSKKLLPVPKIETEEEDEEQKLIRQLEEYSLFKEVTGKLETIDDYDKLYKEPDKIATGYRYELPENLSFDNLINAFTKLMHNVKERAEIPQPKEIAKDRFTVAQKITEIKDMLRGSKKIKFSEVYSNDYSKSEVINTFLALLELLKVQVIKVTQEKLFAEIEIERSSGYGKDDNIVV